MNLVEHAVLLARRVPQIVRQFARHSLCLLALLSPAIAMAVFDCSVSASPLAFRIFDPDGGDFDSDSGQVTVSCTVASAPAPGLVSYTISMPPGNAGSYSPRRLQNGAYTLRYNLFTAPGRGAGQVWGDNTSGTVTVGGSVTQLDTVGVTRSTDHIVHGRIAGQQAPVAVGNYGDSSLISIAF